MNTNGVDPWLASRPHPLPLAGDTLHVPSGKAAASLPPPVESRGCGSARVGEIHRGPYIIRTCVFHRYRKYIRAGDSGSVPRHVRRGAGFSGSSPRHLRALISNSERRRRRFLRWRRFEKRDCRGG